MEIKGLKNNLFKDGYVQIISLLITIIVLVMVRLWIIPTYFLLLIIGINFYLLLKNKINEIEFILYTMIMPSELYSFLGLGIGVLSIFYKIIKGKVFIDINSKKNKWLKILIAFLILSGIVSSIVNKSLINAILSIGYILAMLFLFKITEALKYSLEDFLKFMDKILIIQTVMVIVQFFNYGILQPSDSYSGTFVNAHRFSVWLIFYGIISIINIKNNNYKFTKKDIVKIISIIILIYLTDGKHIVLATILAVILWASLSLIKKVSKNKILISGLVILTLLYVGTNLGNSNNFKNYINNKSYYLYKYIYLEPYNNKFDYFNKTLNKSNIILGYGPGQYGSRAANLRAYEYMAKEDGLAIALSKVIPPYVEEDYKEFAKKYDEEYLSKVKGMSAVLSYPFSSIISLIAELGIIGYIILLMFFNSIEKEMNDSLWSLITITLFTLMIFDSYFEMTAVISFFWVIMAISKNQLKNKKIF